MSNVGSEGNGNESDGEMACEDELQDPFIRLWHALLFAEPSGQARSSWTVSKAYWHATVQFTSGNAFQELPGDGFWACTASARTVNVRWNQGEIRVGLAHPW